MLGPGLLHPAIRELVPPELLATDLALNYPDGRRLIELFECLWAAGHRENAWLLEPRYLRSSAAEEKWESLKRDERAS